MEQTENLGHGTSESPEIKDWQDISSSDLHSLQQHYPQFVGQQTILWRSPRPFSAALLLQVNAQIFFVKRSSRLFRSAQDLQQEHQLIRYMDEQGIAVPKIVFAHHGATAVELGEWSYEVHEKAHGVDPYANQLSWKPFFCAAHAAKAGQKLADLHQAAKHYPVTHGRSAKQLISNQDLLESENIQLAISHRIQNSPALSAYFADKVLDETWLNQLSSAHSQIKSTMQQVPKIWTHNDFHASNLLWSDATDVAEITTVIDFGLADRCSAIYDLAVAIERNFIDWLALAQRADLYIDEAGLIAFIQAYIEQAGLSPELHILPELIKIVHSDFALSELEYFAGITQNIKHADAAYYDWLIGHTAWFFQPQGLQFCHKLAQLIQSYKGCADEVRAFDVYEP